MTRNRSRRKVRPPDGWTIAVAGMRIPVMEESPGSMGKRYRLTAGGGDPRDSATENRPPAGLFLLEHVAGKGETVR
ncbi:hypothetical protein AD940_06180 [Gluconobacter thailandicus]|nr:hypothetical protein AD940_06180 [Gluconobacter thailandicus]